MSPSGGGNGGSAEEISQTIHFKHFKQFSNRDFKHLKEFLKDLFVLIVSDSIHFKSNLLISVSCDYLLKSHFTLKAHNKIINYKNSKYIY